MDDDAPPAPAATAPAAVVTPPPIDNTPATAPTVAAPPVSRPLVTTSPAVRSLAEEAGVEGDPYYDSAPVGAEYVDPSHPDLAAAANVPAGPPAVRQIAPPAVAPLPSRPAYDTRGANEVLPTASSLVATGTTLPDMRLDIHVYSNTPTERFVFINMRKYLEGQAITEGPTVERITPEGAVLNSQGLRFLLPRQ
jgi:general secretion pathway protein B